MTQNVMQVVSDAPDAVSGAYAGTPNHPRVRPADTLLPVVGFGVGALVAVIGYQYGSFWALLFPILLPVILTLRAGPGKCTVGE